MFQGSQRAVARQHEQLMAEGQRWRAGRDQEKGAATDKKYRALKTTEEALAKRHAALAKKYGELVARVEKLARDHADKKTDPKKAAAGLDALAREEAALGAEQQKVFGEHARLVGADAGQTDAGVADAGAADGGIADAGHGADAGALDGGSPVDAGAPAPAVDAGTVAAPPARSCTVVDGGFGWLAFGAFWWARRQRLFGR